MTAKVFEIWAEGYVITGNESDATLLRKIEAPSFKAACDKLALDDEDFAKHYEPDTLRYWGCALFDNEADARKSFG